MAISIIEKQTNLLVKDLIEYSIKNRKVLNLYDLNTYRRDVLDTLLNFQSIFQAIKLPARSGENIYRSHMKNISDISMDFSVINDTINELYNLIQMIQDVSSVNNVYKQNIIAQLTTAADNIRANINSNAFVYTIDFSSNDDIDQQNTTAFIDNENRQCKSKEMSLKDILYFGEYEESDISVSYVGDFINSKSKQGQVYRMLKRGDFNKPVEFIVDQSKRAELSIRIDIPVGKDRSLRSVNNVSMQTIGYYTEFDARFYVSKNGKDYTPVSDYIPNSNNSFNIHFKNDKYKYIRIEMKKTIEDTRAANRFTYMFGIRSVAIRNSGFSTASIMTTTGLIKRNTDDEIITPQKVSIQVNDFTPPNTSINYFVKRSQDADWKSVTPTNKFKAANNIIEFGKTKEFIIDDVVPEESDSMWTDISPYNMFGNVPLYNILSKVNDESDESLYNPLVDSDSESDNYQGITTESGDFLDPSTVELKRGKGDYSVTTQIADVSAKVEKLKYSFKYNEFESKFNEIDLYITLENIPHKVNEGGYIQLSDYDIVNSEFITVYRNGKKQSITYDEDTKRIQLQVYNVADVVYVTFNASVASVEIVQDSEIVIDEDSFIFTDTIANTELENGNFELDLSNNLIDMNVNTAMSTSTLGDIQVNVSFDYIIKKNNKGIFYQTFIENKEEITLLVIPFNAKEIQFGNFHRVDGIIVSEIPKVKLQPGKHVIESTQPYPTDPVNMADINKYTLESSLAGIIIPNNVIQYAFELPQRRVSLFNLSNVVNIDDHRSFAVEDNKIWINRVPHHIPQYIMGNHTKNHLVGNELYGKKSTYLNGKFDGYITIPETFTVSYGTFQKEQEEIFDNYVAVKADLLLHEGNTEITPLINEIAIRFL